MADYDVPDFVHRLTGVFRDADVLDETEGLLVLALTLRLLGVRLSEGAQIKEKMGIRYVSGAVVVGEGEAPQADEHDADDWELAAFYTEFHRRLKDVLALSDQITPTEKLFVTRAVHAGFAETADELGTAIEMGFGPA